MIYMKEEEAKFAATDDQNRSAFHISSLSFAAAVFPMFTTDSSP